jgi:hypothetical protein
MSDRTPRFLHKYIDVWEVLIDRTRSLLVDGYWHEKSYRKNFPAKEEDFKYNQKLAEDLLEALQVLLSEADGFRDKPGVQPYINNIVGGINIHLNRVVKYHQENDPKTHQKKEDQKLEGSFQRLVFKGKREIKDKLSSLNINNTMEGFSVEFFNDLKATLPFKKILCARYPDIAAKVETLEVDWDLIQDSEIHINRSKKDIPDWNEKLHFWDQEIDTLQYWISEYNKCQKGLTIDGVYIHPWLYYHINFFKTPIGDEGDDILVPELRDNEWYIQEILKYTEEEIAKMQDAGMAIFGSRRYGKSTGEASWSCHGILTNPTKNGVVCSTNEKDILALTDKIDIGMTYLPQPFKIHINSKDWTKQVRFGLKTKSSEEIKYFYLDIVNLDSGSKRGGQKLAGIAPAIFVLDEFAKEKFMTAYNALIPALETNKGWKTIPWLTGTGGDIDLSSEAEKALANPKNHRIVEMNWDILEKMVPKEFITWVRRPFGWFIPAQMSQRTGHIKNKISLSEFLGVESETLSRIKINATDWENNTKICKDKRKQLKSDKEQLQKEIVYYPLDPEECFMSAKNNPYPAQGIKRHKEKLQSEGDSVHGTARKIELYRREDNSVAYRLSNKEVNEFPHNGKFTDCPFLLYDEFPETPPYDPYRFVAGFDDYKQDQSEGDSIAAFYIFDRLKRKIVLSLANRPDPHPELHKQIHMAQDAFNCKNFLENEDMDYKKYLDRVSNPSLYLYTGFDAYGDFSKFSNGTRKFGWKPDRNTSPQVRGYTIEYAKDDLEQKSEGESDMVYGYERIEDIQLLEEMTKYKEGGNFDRIVGFGSCLAIDYYLTSKYITAKTNSKNTRKEQEGRQTQKPIRNKFYTDTRRSTFSKKPKW